MRVGEMKFNQIFAGEVNYVTNVPVGAGTYKRGDLLENVVTSNALSSAYAQCKSAGTASIANAYVVCAEDTVLEGEGKVVAYKEGHFDREFIMLNGTVANDNSVEVLKTKNIFLETTK